MSATGFHGVQITTLSDQLKRYFGSDNRVYIGVDSFVYYQEGDRRKFVDTRYLRRLRCRVVSRKAEFLHLGGRGGHLWWCLSFFPNPQRSTTGVIKSDNTIVEIEVNEYFIHQPEGAKSPEFRGWCRSPSGAIEEIQPDAQGGLFSHALNMWLRWEYQPVSEVRLLRPYHSS